jgi:hypothetical protein
MTMRNMIFAFALALPGTTVTLAQGPPSAGGGGGSGPVATLNLSEYSNVAEASVFETDYIELAHKKHDAKDNPSERKAIVTLVDSSDNPQFPGRTQAQSLGRVGGSLAKTVINGGSASVRSICKDNQSAPNTSRTTTTGSMKLHATLADDSVADVSLTASCNKLQICKFHAHVQITREDLDQPGNVSTVLNVVLETYQPASGGPQKVRRITSDGTEDITGPLTAGDSVNLRSGDLITIDVWTEQDRSHKSRGLDLDVTANVGLVSAMDDELPGGGGSDDDDGGSGSGGSGGDGGGPPAP